MVALQCPVNTYCVRLVQFPQRYIRYNRNGISKMSILSPEILEILKRNIESEDEFDDLIDAWMRIRRSRSEQHCGGSVVGRKVVKRKIHQGHRNIIRDYFAPQPVSEDRLFRRRFRMR